ncbi:hypothetical protein HMPREF9466_01521 [Fusobacterium necrophorum subsp. funduliforme 1_1_36S]|nr:hypothetical protein HMPREF9466_01521 [Fusobacterium necrophorum subsp. funduliforme 1_1_36S]
MATQNNLALGRILCKGSGLRVFMEITLTKKMPMELPNIKSLDTKSETCNKLLQKHTDRLNGTM